MLNVSYASSEGLMFGADRDVLERHLAETVNPLNLSGGTWAAGWIMRFFAVAVFDWILEYGVVKRVWNLMPSRLAGMKSNLRVRLLDRLCLLSNSIIEMVFIYNVLWVFLGSSELLWGWSTFTLANSVGASVALFFTDDLIYNLAHRFMHWRPVYPYIHKIHHRQYLPERGYWDAAVEHPIEQVIGLGVFWTSLKSVMYLFGGMHVVGFAVSFFFYSFFNIVNHMPYDCSFRFLGFTYETRDHETHHRFPNYNFSKSCMFWDRLLGTYREYQGAPSGKNAKAKTS